MATGTMTIPVMKRSGFPPELAGNIESNASYLGNMIPPSSNIVVALGAFVALYPETEMSTGTFWIVLWSISGWFIAQRLLMVFGFCKYYKVKPMPKEEIPKFDEVFKAGCQGLLTPFVILLPFLLDYFFSATLFTECLGVTGAKYLPSSMPIFIPGIAAIYTCFITKNKNLVRPHEIAKMFANGVKTIAPAVGVCVIGYMIGALFNDLNVAEEMDIFILSISFNKFGLVNFICILTCFLGMVIPDSSLVVIFGPVFITMFASVGVDAVLAAAMLSCICGVMCGIPPLLDLVCM